MELQEIRVDQTNKPVTTTDLNALIDPKSITHLRNTFTDYSGLVKALRSDIHNGITEASIPMRIEMYGSNKMPPPKTYSFFRFIWIALRDRMVLFLLGAAVVSLGTGLYQTFNGEANAWLEALAIIVAILVIVLVNSINDYRKQARFKMLEDESKSRRHVKVLRDGVPKQIPNDQLVVGDILFVAMGDVVPCDGVLLEGNYIKCDESSLTGESDQIIKDSEDPFMLSGSTVTDGTGRMIVTSVGPQSMMGRMTLDLRTMPPPTDLQLRLTRVASRLAKGGFAVAAVTLVALIAIYFIKGAPGELIDEIATIIFVGISIVVMAIPEGLGLSIVLTLSRSTIYMLKDNCLVRYLGASEVMGGVTTICTDKTGTLTQNKMEVVNASVFEKDFDREHVNDDLSVGNEEQIQRLMDNIMLNSEAYEGTTPDGKETFLGSKTDVALLIWARKKGFDYKEARKTADIIDTIPFSSERKRMSTVVQNGKNTIEYTKGASEIVLDLCDRYVASDGSINGLDEPFKKKALDKISEYAKESFRTIVCAYRGMEEDQYIFSGLFGIEDPLRADAKNSVRECQNAGVTVIMVTGDNVLTGSAIARQCGILTAAEHKVIEGPDFRKLTDPEVDELLPELRVVARSSPNDKLLLVKALQRNDHIVAMTGDGVNDSTSLLASNVGFSMGTGSESAKKASSIVILDDSFKSMVSATKWGRQVYTNVRKFLMFQIPVNLSSVIIVVVTSLSSAISTAIPAPALLTLMILYTNLVSDSLASLALSTDKPSEGILNTKPRQKSESIISPFMWSMIIAQTLYQTVLGLLTFYLVPIILGTYDYALRTTLTFNVFVYAVLFNQLNCRNVTSDLNLFKGILKNKFFLPLFVVGLLLQIVIVQFLGFIFETTPIMSVTIWVVSIVLGTGSLLVGLFVRLVWKARYGIHNIK